MRKFIEAKRNNEPHVMLWGTGTPQREFLHVDDLADACYFLMENFSEEGLVNIGTGVDIAIKDLALLIKKTVGYQGEIKHDLSKPDGTPRKLMTIKKLKGLGWEPKITLEQGVQMVYDDVKHLEWEMA